MTLTKYSRAEISISDHKPIYAHFKVKVNKINAEAKALVEGNLIAKFSAMKVNQRNQNEHDRKIKKAENADAGAVISDADFSQSAAASDKSISEDQSNKNGASSQENQNVKEVSPSSQQKGNLSMAEPKIGDLGLDVEDQKLDDNILEKNISREKANLNVRESELQEYIRTASIQLTEDQMRQAEETYVCIDEKSEQSVQA